jgi:hypothetical protein
MTDDTSDLPGRVLKAEVRARIARFDPAWLGYVEGSEI